MVEIEYRIVGAVYEKSVKPWRFGFGFFRGHTDKTAFNKVVTVQQLEQIVRVLQMSTPTVQPQAPSRTRKQVKAGKKVTVTVQ